MASAAARLLRAYATQVEALRRLRNGGSQTLRVEHVHVHDGGQAVIGNVRSKAAGEGELSSSRRLIAHEMGNARTACPKVQSGDADD